MIEIFVPLLVLGVLIAATIKKMPSYKLFAQGVKQASELVISVFPYLLTILIMAQLFKASGLSELCAKFLSPAFALVGIPKELCELILLRPFTGAGSLALLDDIYTTYGVDSYIARCASIIVGSSDTVFYISVIYFSASKIQKTRFAIPLALLINFLSAILACALA